MTLSGIRKHTICHIKCILFHIYLCCLYVIIRRHGVETPSTLVDLCEGNHLRPMDSPRIRPLWRFFFFFFFFFFLGGGGGGGGGRCGRSGLWPFRFVAVSVSGRLVSGRLGFGRFGLWQLWPESVPPNIVAINKTWINNEQYNDISVPLLSFFHAFRKIPAHFFYIITSIFKLFFFPFFCLF